MKKVLSVLTIVVFCMAALNLNATDKNTKKNAKSKKVKVNKAVLNTTVTNAFRGQTASFYADLKGKGNKKE